MQEITFVGFRGLLVGRLNRGFFRVFALGITAIFGCTDQVVDPPPDGGMFPAPLDRIFFVSNRETSRSNQIYSMDPDGSDIGRISYPLDSITFEQVALSPYLNRMAVVWNYWDDRRGEYPSLAIADTLGNYLYSLSDYCSLVKPLWSPNGESIAFTRAETYFGGTLNIYVVDSEGGMPVEVTHFTSGDSLDTSAVALQWVADSMLIVSLSVLSPSEVKLHIVELNLNGVITSWIFVDDGVTTYSPVNRSPDRETLIYRYFRDGLTAIGIADSMGMNQTTITPELDYSNEGSYDANLCWSPDGNRVAFSASIYGQSPPWGEIFSVTSSGTNMTRIVGDSMSVSHVMDWK